MTEPFVKIFTEENPQEQEICTGLQILGYDVKTCTITPSYENNKFKGEFNVQTVPININCIIILFKGTTGSVDYMFFEEGKNALFMESTKTSDKDSRNSAIYQRLIKFPVAKIYYPNANYVMFYSEEPSFVSDTGKFGIKLFATIGVDIYTPNKKLDASPFTSIDDLIMAKNNMKQKAGNASVRITKSESLVTISGRLDKTNGRMDNDPNIGLICGMIVAMNSLDKTLTFRITDHRLDISKIQMNNKFWYSIMNINVEIDGFVKQKCEYPLTYYKEVKTGEKISTILFQHQTGLLTIFHNHAGCQRASLIGKDGKHYPIPKTTTMPDLVQCDNDKRIIYVTEGKNSSKIKNAEEQLKNLTEFESLIKLHYPEHTILKGLCLFIDNKFKNNSTFPVWFSLYESGIFSKTLNT